MSGRLKKVWSLGSGSYSTRGSWRAREQVRRVLTLIDLMAAQPRSKTALDLRDLLPDRVHERTIQRDLDLLESLGLVHTVGKATHTGVRNPARLWALDLTRTERLQEAAMLLDE